MRTLALVLGLLSICLAAPVDQQEPEKSGHVESPTLIGAPLAQTPGTTATTQTIYFPVPRPGTVFNNPYDPQNTYPNYYNPYNMFNMYNYGLNPSINNPLFSAYTLPPIVISLPKLTR